MYFQLTVPGDHGGLGAHALSLVVEDNIHVPEHALIHTQPTVVFLALGIQVNSVTVTIMLVPLQHREHMFRYYCCHYFIRYVKMSLYLYFNILNCGLRDKNAICIIHFLKYPNPPSSFFYFYIIRLKIQSILHCKKSDIHFRIKNIRIGYLAFKKLQFVINETRLNW